MSRLSRREWLKLVGSSCAAARWREVCPSGPGHFTDVTRPAAIAFVHDNAASPEKYLIETMGAGCAWIDYNQDGLMDLYLVNSAATRLYTPKQPLRSALCHNNGDGTFTDVTTRAGVAGEGLIGM